ncbi:MAG TPA: signal peptidase II [Candidatus Gracilibacteria bacterium]
MKKYALPSIVILIMLDQWTKSLAVKYLQEPWVIVKYWLELRLAENEGVAFSLPVPSVLVLLLALCVVGYLAYQIRTKNLFNIEVFVYILVMAGAIGNVIDRLMNQGKVIDFIAIGSWPVFNVADSCITVGIVVYMAWELFGKKSIK